MWASALLAELGLVEFEAQVCCKYGTFTLEQLAQVKYEDLLEIGLSKVQCHLFLQKVADCVADSGHIPGLTGNLEDGVIKICDAHESDVEREGRRMRGHCHEGDGEATDAESAHRMLKDVDPRLMAQASGELPPGLRRAALRSLMPPPRSPALDAASLQVRTSRKRAHSSHLSNHAAWGSEALSTVGSPSRSSSSSLHLDIRVKKRRVDGRFRSVTRDSHQSPHSIGPCSVGARRRLRSPTNSCVAAEATDVDHEHGEEAHFHETDSHSL
mmetsp:Transcript_52445/g.147189  ORF Transcript_52445/g.147189 Transcript_52445/m.147189 type:complete len:270 (+) Transcript_52445:145-954(+)